MQRKLQQLSLALLLPALLSCGSKSKQTAADAADPCRALGTASEVMACVDQARLSADINQVAMERVPGSTHWQTTQDLCRTRLTEYGFEVELVSYDTGVNVIGRRPGSLPDGGDVIISAHYDHIEGCPGASDNAAGLAATLEIARLLGAREIEQSLVIACWDEEERGLLGSRAYADAARAENQKITAMISFDTIGYRENGIYTQTLPDGFEALFPNEHAIVEANEFRADFLSLTLDESSHAVGLRLYAHADSIGLNTSVLEVPETLKLNAATSDLRRSDHASFWQNDYPGILLSDTANFRNPNYHCLDGIDLPGTLDMEFVVETTQIALGAAIDTLGSP